MKPVAGYYRGLTGPRRHESPRDVRRRDRAVLHLPEPRARPDLQRHRPFRLPRLQAPPRPRRPQDQRHAFSAIVIPKLSRFGRSVKDLVELFDLFDRDGIALVFLDMNIDTATSQGRLLRHIMAAFAEYESDVKSDYSRATQRLLAREGRPGGPWAPFGYVVKGKRADKTYVEDPATAPIVRDLYDRYLEGTSFNRLAQDLNERGVTGPKGGEWSRQRVKMILDNPAYAAFRVYEGEEYASSWPALVTRGTWDACKGKRNSSRTTYVDPPGHRTGLLSGLLTCGLCGKNLHHGHQNDRDDIYRCMTGDDDPPRCLGGQIKADRAEHLLTGAFLEAMTLAGADATKLWTDAAFAARRTMLSSAMKKVVLLPRPAGNRNGKGMPIGRSLRIEWSHDLSRKAFGYAGATSTLTPKDRHLMSPKGKTWREWQTARLVPH